MKMEDCYYKVNYISVLKLGALSILGDKECVNGKRGEDCMNGKGGEDCMNGKGVEDCMNGKGVKTA